MLKARIALVAFPISLSFGDVASAANLTLAPLAPRTMIAATGAVCAKPIAPARMLDAVVEYPDFALIASHEGTTDVGVQLSEDGKLVRAWTLQTSGDAMLDLAALQSARSSRYTAERFNCENVAGEYRISVDFTL